MSEPSLVIEIGGFCEITIQGKHIIIANNCIAGCLMDICHRLKDMCVW